MIWIYILTILSIIILSIVYSVSNIKAIRLLGCELSGVIIYLLFLTIIMDEIFLPIPEYYIKHGVNKNIANSESRQELSLNEILEEEALKSGIEFDAGSFRIIDSHGMHFNHLFLCSYEINGKEEVRVFHFEKNIFGNMKPKYPLNNAYIIRKKSNIDDFYRTYVEDGIFGRYLITAGYASESTVLQNYKLNKFRINQIYPTDYFMWVEMVSEPWKSMSVKLTLYIVLFGIIERIRKRKHDTIKFYSKWRKGDKVFQLVKKEENI